MRSALPDLDELRRRASRIKGDSAFSERLIAAFVLTREQREPSAHVEEQIYDSFASNDDNALMDRFHDLDWPHRTPLIGQLSDERLRSLGQRLVYVEAPDVMTEAARRDYDVAIARRLMAADGTVPWLTLSKALAEADGMLAGAEGPELTLLTGHRDYLRQRAEWAASLLA
jgi:exodeoxyribonuclease-1